MMKKLTALVCAAALALSAVPVLANPSIGDLSGSAGKDDITVISELSDPENMWVEVKKSDINTYGLEEVKEVIADLNDPQKKITVQDIVDKLKDFQPVDEETNEPVLPDVAGYDFVTGSADIVLTNGTDIWFNDNGNDVECEAELKIDAMKGADKATIANYRMMLINVEDGEITLIEMDPETLKPDEGKIKVHYPTLGVFTLIQK